MDQKKDPAEETTNIDTLLEEFKKK